MKDWIIRYCFFFMGLLLFGLGNALAVKVKYLGLHPWEVLNVAFEQKFGYTIGTWSVITGLFLVGVSWFMHRKYISIGTFLNAMLIGPFMDFFLWLDILPDRTDTWLDYTFLLAAIIIGGIAGGMYVAGGVGAGPRDGFMLSVSDRTKLSISKARIVVESVVLVIGWALGGPIGIVTFFYTLLFSPIFQFTLKRFVSLREKLTGSPAPQKVKV